MALISCCDSMGQGKGCKFILNYCILRLTHDKCVISNLWSLKVWPGCHQTKWRCMCMRVLLERVCFLVFSSFCSLPVSLALDFVLSSELETSIFWVHVFHHTFLLMVPLPSFKWVVLDSQIIQSLLFQTLFTSAVPAHLLHAQVGSSSVYGNGIVLKASCNCCPSNVPTSVLWFSSILHEETANSTSYSLSTFTFAELQAFFSSFWVSWETRVPGEGWGGMSPDF